MTLLTSGWLSRPVSRHVRLRRSTLLLLAVFVVLTALYLLLRTEGDAAGALIGVMPT